MLQQAGQGCVDPEASLMGKSDEYTSTVALVRQPLDEPFGFEPVDAVRHRTAGHHGLADEPAGSECVGVAGATQGRQHVELPRLQAVFGEGVPASEIQVAGQASDSAQHLHRGNVEVWTLALPGVDEPVHLVLHSLHRSQPTCEDS